MTRLWIQGCKWHVFILGLLFILLVIREPAQAQNALATKSSLGGSSTGLQVLVWVWVWSLLDKERPITSELKGCGDLNNGKIHPQNRQTGSSPVHLFLLRSDKHQTSFA